MLLCTMYRTRDVIVSAIYLLKLVLKQLAHS